MAALPGAALLRSKLVEMLPEEAWPVRVADWDPEGDRLLFYVSAQSLGHIKMCRNSTLHGERPVWETELPGRFS